MESMEKIVAGNRATQQVKIYNSYDEIGENFKPIAIIYREDTIEGVTKWLTAIQQTNEDRWWNVGRVRGLIDLIINRGDKTVDEAVYAVFKHRHPETLIEQEIDSNWIAVE